MYVSTLLFLVMQLKEVPIQYYEAIGPHPPRLQPPLWASPPSTPTSASASLQENPDVASHKAAISRHRYDWDRAKTPPGYWNIGFPSTQEVMGINEKAMEMHRRKREMVEREAK
jgi:DNA repair protein endonuclease SAE2/CtIP C-terminus